MSLSRPEFAVYVLLDDLARRRDNLALPLRSPTEPPQGFKDRGDLLLVETRPRRKRKLLFDIVVAVEQDAAGGLAVPPGPPGFLDVVFQRTRDVGVDDQTDVGLVDSHAEGVGGRDHTEHAVRELLLSLQLGFRH